jgi:hypothetical protein
MRVRDGGVAIGFEMARGTMVYSRIQKARIYAKNYY